MKAHSDTLMVLLFCLCVSCGSSSAWSAPQTMHLTLPAFEDDSHQYFHELLTDALADIDVTLTIEASSKHYSQRRTVKLLEKGELSAMWLVSSRQRDLLFHRVNVPLTNGLIGKRVLLIPKGAQSLYNRIQSLEDLQKSGLVAGLGVGWFDVTVWQANGLKYLTKDGEWRQLYNMLSNRGGVNYFPRGLNEVVNEAKLNLHLDIEQNFVFEYERDFVFYLSSVDGYQEKLIEEALVKAQKTGLIQKLIDKYWQQDFEHLGLENRKTIKLVTPK
ncbi:hypothetical protein [Vibrio tapetis]|uniref:Solute-binding protein family 3/N-terminal domain-containing protein n=1 Tax=Vibrio tapetis subsp. tapetis TaxID=1671868 RepID=A0A2N8Z9F8_9VIBR|nr:hypothetical protein [Vibrio tapetis]SON48555.1 conserved exported protein of unknown function [Vibrio tapetis subsp. tapetis]